MYIDKKCTLGYFLSADFGVQQLSLWSQCLCNSFSTLETKQHKHGRLQLLTHDMYPQCVRLFVSALHKQSVWALCAPLNTHSLLRCSALLHLNGRERHCFCTFLFHVHCDRDSIALFNKVMRIISHQTCSFMWEAEAIGCSAAYYELGHSCIVLCVLSTLHREFIGFQILAVCPF